MPRRARLLAAGCLLALVPTAVAAAPVPVRPRPPGAEPARRGEASPPAVPSDDAEEGDRALVIDRVEVEGREQVSARQIDRVLAREGVVAGEEILWPSDPRIERARDRLRATGYFKRVTLRVETVDDSPDRVVLHVELEERSSVDLQELYLGTSRMTPLRAGMALAERNFLGRSIHLGGALLWSTLPRIERARRQQAYRAFFEAPRLGRTVLGVLGSAYFLSASEPYRIGGAEDDPDPSLFRTFDYTRIGGLVGLTFSLLPELTLGADYRFERVDAIVPQDAARVSETGEVVDADIDIERGIHRLTAAHFGLVYDGREEVFLVGKGGRFALDLQLSSPAIGSSYEYVKLVAGGAYSFRLPWRHWLTPSLSGGQIAGLAPVFEQFYSGDLSSWTPGREQGLRFSTRNPIDVFKTGIGKRTFGAIFGRADLEYVIPLFRYARTRGVYGGDLFLSFGVFTLVGDREERAARRAAGERVAPVGMNANLGLRLDTAIGTIDVSIGNLLRRVPL